eukprot:gene10876-17000_t
MWKDKVISVEQPITCEGVIVYTKLEAMVRAIAHEFVHVLVAVFFLDTIELSAAYYGCPTDSSPYHGPIFKLNHQPPPPHPTHPHLHVQALVRTIAHEFVHALVAVFFPDIALVHTIAHEFVHALVAVFFPDTIELSAAYYGKNDASPYHGPTFKLLNRRIFDHNNTSWCTTLAEPHDKYGEPLKAPKKEKREVWDEQGFL